MATITVSGTLIDLTGGLIQNGTVVFTLQNYGGQLPTVAGSGEIIGLQVTATSNSSGVFTIQLWGNDVIVPGPNTTYYQVVYKDNSGINPISNLYQFFGAGPINLTSYPPITSVPATPILSPVVTNPTALQTIQTYPLQVLALQLGTASDTGISRTQAGTIALGNGTQADSSGKLLLRDLTLSGGTLDASAAAHTLPVLKGTLAAKPATATVGELYFATDAAAGVNLFFATATNTWSQMSATGTYTPAGSNKQLQYNNSGAAAGTAQLTFDNAQGNTTLQATAAATSGSNPTAPILTIGTNYWNGSASASDLWNIQDVLGSTGANPTSTLTITHAAGSTNITQVSVPLLTVDALNLIQIGGDSNGSIELGPLNKTGTGNTPFLDFHFHANNTLTDGQDFNVRLINIADNVLGVTGPSGAKVRLDAAGVVQLGVDTGISRDSAGAVAIGNGFQNDKSGFVAATRFITDSVSTGAIAIKSPSILLGGTASGLVWTNSGTYLGTQDTGIFRDAAGVVDIGNGNLKDVTGTLQLTNLFAQSAGVVKFSTDIGISRGAASQLNVGNGTQGDSSANLSLASLLVANGGVVKFGTDTGVSRGTAGQTNLGNGTAGDKTGNLGLNAIAQYDGVTTVDKGVGYIVAAAHPRGLTAVASATNIIASVATTGLYRVNHIATTTTANGGAWNLNLNIIFNDGTATRTFAVESIDLSTAGNTPPPNTAGGYAGVFRFASGTAVQYSTTLVGGSRVSGVYDLDISIERLF